MNGWWTRRAALTGLVGGAGAVVAACGGESSTGQPSRTQGPVTLRFAADKGRLDAGVQAVIDAFNARGGPIKVEVDLVTGSIVERIITQGAAGELPDLTHTHPRDYHVWVNGGLLVPLDDYIKKDKTNAPDVLPTALDYWNRDGKRWAMPNNLSVQNIYFNKQIFDRRGVKYPDAYEKDGKWTFETYLDLARQLTTGAGSDKIFGATWMHGLLDIQLGFIWPFGGDLWDKDRTKTTLDSKEALEAIQFQADLTHKYGVAPTSEEWQPFSTAPSPTWGAAFSAGRAAMELQPNDSLVQHVMAATFPKGHVPMPKGRAGRIVRGLAVGAHVTKGSKNPDAAFEHANFQAGKESEKIMLGLHVSLPWHKSTLDKMDQSMFQPWESATYYQEGVRRLRPTPYVSKFTDISNLYNANYTAVRHGQKTAVQMITEIKPQIDSFLRG